MENHEDREIRRLLRRALPPVGETEFDKDLWPRVNRKLGDWHVPSLWFDLVLVAAALLWLVFLPEVIPGLLYQL